MLWHTGLKQLHNACANLYDTVDDARRVADQSGLERERINFQGSASNIWHSLILEAERCGQTLMLITFVREEYPNYRPLQVAEHQYCQAQQGVAMSLPGYDDGHTSIQEDVEGEFDEVTTRRYGVHESIKPPTLGHLVRVTPNFKLPQSLAIYRLQGDRMMPRYLRIGRNRTTNTLVIRERSISREHALLAQNAGKLYLRDNASTMGTYLNWRRLEIDEELLVRSGDLIGFGNVVYEFIDANDSP